MGDYGVRTVKFAFDGVFEDILDRVGNMPLPPYIHEKLADKTRYNTVYSKTDGSAAAPTAGLHFTPELIQRVKDVGADFCEVLLHIGIDTVKLNGEGFTPHVKKGDRVSVGSPLCTVDLKLLKDKGFDVTSPLVITSQSVDKVRRLTLRTGDAKAGETVVMRYSLAKK